MWRALHSWLGVLLAVLLLFMAGTGGVLALKPILDAEQAPPQGHFSAAEVIEHIAQKNPHIEVQQLRLEPNGQAQLTYSRRHRQRQSLVDLATGKLSRIPRLPHWYEWTRSLHRALLMDGKKGRAVAAIAALAMSLISLSALFLLVRRLGGWRKLWHPMRWRGLENIHAALGRIVLIPLALSAFSALWLSAVTFHLIASGSDTPPHYPESLKKGKPVPPWTLHGLREIPMSEVRAIVYPVPEDWFDVWTVKTTRAYLFIDRFSGDVLAREALKPTARAFALAHFLHTAEGSLFWAVVLLLTAFSVPLFVVTGVILWWRRQRRAWKNRPRPQARAAQATVVIAVGTESGSTWAFAKALHEALSQAGEQVRSVELNALKRHYPALRTLLVLTATYGDGDAPQSGNRFLAHLKKHQSPARFAVLAFGDRAFPAFCAFGHRCHQALAAHYGAALLPCGEIDRRSPQAFAHWCEDLARALGTALDVRYTPPKPVVQTLVLRRVRHLGAAVGVHIALMELAGCKAAFEAGDLLSVYAPDADAPRLYSIGSNAAEGVIKLSVREQEDGQCSPWLCSRAPGDAVAAEVIPNPRFHFPRGKKPVVLIAAGVGLAPFLGMIAGQRGRIVDLYWGGRHPEADALYDAELRALAAQGKLTHWVRCWSRLAEDGRYVQDALDEVLLTRRLQAGAVVMVCGGRAMGAAVAERFEALLRPLGMTLSALRAAGRYREDIF